MRLRRLVRIPAATLSRLTLAVVLFLSVPRAPGSPADVERRDFFVKSDPGVQVFVREVSAKRARRGPPMLLVHGARVAGLASFDLPVAGGSLAGDLALDGFDVYVLDIRGYGRSTRPRAMSGPPEAHPPLVRSMEAARDISAVVDYIRARHPSSRVVLFGWATGGQWAGYYASTRPEQVAALVLLNSLYRGNSKHEFVGKGSDLEDPAHPGRFNQGSCGAYRTNDGNSLLRAWDRSIPEGDRSLWRDPAVADAYVRAALESDPTSKERRPPSFRSPCGALEDSFYLATGRQLWDASLITAPVLVLASERDFWSRPEDRENLVADLVHSSKVRAAVIPGATHFVHLDRGERGRNRMLDEVRSFLNP